MAASRNRNAAFMAATNLHLQQRVEGGWLTLAQMEMAGRALEELGGIGRGGGDPRLLQMLKERVQVRGRG